MTVAIIIIFILVIFVITPNNVGITIIIIVNMSIIMATAVIIYDIINAIVNATGCQHLSTHCMGWYR